MSFGFIFTVEFLSVLYLVLMVFLLSFVVQVAKGTEYVFSFSFFLYYIIELPFLFKLVL